MFGMFGTYTFDDMSKEDAWRSKLKAADFRVIECVAYPRQVLGSTMVLEEEPVDLRVPAPERAP